MQYLQLAWYGFLFLFLAYVLFIGYRGLFECVREQKKRFRKIAGIAFLLACGMAAEWSIGTQVVFIVRHLVGA